MGLIYYEYMDNLRQLTSTLVWLSLLLSFHLWSFVIYRSCFFDYYIEFQKASFMAQYQHSSCVDYTFASSPNSYNESLKVYRPSSCCVWGVHYVLISAWISYLKVYSSYRRLKYFFHDSFNLGRFQRRKASSPVSIF